MIEIASPFHMNPNTQMQEFSFAYINAIASAAGYAFIIIPKVDEDSVDIMIQQRGRGDQFPLIDTLNIQVKSTYAYEPKGGFISYPLEIKNYDDLRRESSPPRILVVVHVPKEKKDWLIHAENSMILNYSAYWLSLRGMESTSNKEKIIVKIPLKQRFTTDSLQEMMNGLAEGVKP